MPASPPSTPSAPRRGAARVAGEEARAQALDAHIDQLLLGRVQPAPRAPRRRRVHRVLACVGEPEATRHVLSWTRELARLFDADVTLLHVTQLLPAAALYPAGSAWGFGAAAALPIPDPQAEIERARRILRDARDAISADVPDAALLHREGHPGDEIVRAARELATDLVVIGHHEGGALDRLIVGSTTDHVKNHTQADVLIARAPAAPGSILVGVDGSAPSRQAAQLADAIAQRWSSTLHLLHVTPKAWRTRDDEALARELRAAVLERGTSTPLEGVELDLRVGDARDVLRLAARGMNASLLAVGSRGASGLRSLMLGSVSNALAHESPTSVLLVRGASSPP